MNDIKNNYSSKYKEVWTLAWPVMMTMTFAQTTNIVDMLWIGKLGTNELAAVASMGNVVFVLFGFTQIVNAGTIAVVSRLKGAKDVEGSKRAAAQSVRLGLVLGAITAILAIPVSVPITTFFGGGAEFNYHGSRYIAALMIGFLGVFPGTSINAIFQANGDTRTPMYVALVSNLINIGLDPILIFGWFGFPRMEVFGAGVATAISWGIGTVIMLMLLKRRKLANEPKKSGRYFEYDYSLKVIKIGTPASIAMLARPLSTVFLIRVLGEFGEYGMAAFGLAVRSSGLIWIFHIGISVAVASLVGQALGRNDEAEARAIVRSGMLFTTSLQVVLTTVYVIFAAQIVGFFTNDALVVKEGAMFVTILAYCQIISCFAIPAGAALIGAGHTKPGMFIGITANWVIKLPLAWYLATKTSIGIQGVWWGMAVSIVYEAALIIMVYHKGTWAKKKI